MSIKQIKIFKTKNKWTTNVIKIRWRLIPWGVEKILKNIDPKMVRTKNSRLIMQSKCPTCGIKKSRKEHEAKVLLSNLGIKTPLSKIPLLKVLF